jgi:neutral ceramidase
VLPVQVLRISSTVVTGLPFELTVETGRRIADAVTAATADASTGDGAVDRVIVSSVANEYAGYVTTAEEYAEQTYEGGHTLYGPTTQPFLAAHAAALARATVAATGPVHEALPVRAFDLRIRRRLPTPAPIDGGPAGGGPTTGVVRRAAGPATFTDPTRDLHGCWCFEWFDVEPAALAWHEPMARVQHRLADGTWRPVRREGRRVDDQGWSLQITSLGVDRAAGAHRYVVRWWDPELRGDRAYRFVLLANNGRPELTSAPFT